MINDLVKLFPAVQVSQELCEIEVAKLDRYDSLPLLKDIAGNQDIYGEAAAVGRIFEKSITCSTVIEVVFPKKSPRQRTV